MRTWLAGVWLTLFWILCCSSGVAQTDTSSKLRFEDVSLLTGIDFVHNHGGSGKNYIVETVCSGLALLDYDGDGWTDVFLLNGAYPKNGQPNEALTCRLYRNLGNWHFTDVTELAGVGSTEHGLGVTVGDYDNDGDPDMYLSSFGPNVLYRNQGDGTFSSVANAPRSSETRVGAGVAFLDIEGDGDIDLYVGNYIKFSYDRVVYRRVFGIPGAQGPKDFEPESDQLFRNNGDGSFTDISQESGIGLLSAPTMGVIAFDYNQDGDTDIFACNDSEANFLWDNDGSGHFTEIAVLAGLAYDYKGTRQASMGVDCGDYDGDGWLDLVATNFENEVPNVYRNSAGEFFDDVGEAMGLGVALRDVTWGVVLSDFDNDRFPDLFMACGHLFASVEKADSTIQFARRNFLMKNLAGKRFMDVTASAGSGLEPQKVGRAVGSEDLDRDGDLDIVVLNLNSTPSILRNDTATPDHHWLELNLVGTSTNRDAVGSKVVVNTASGPLVQEVHRGRGYQSHYGNQLHFGLGTSPVVESVEVKWHAGKVEVFRNISSDRKWTLIQGKASH